MQAFRLWVFATKPANGKARITHTLESCRIVGALLARGVETKTLSNGSE